MQPRLLLTLFAVSAHGQLTDHQDPKVLLCRVALQLFGPQCVLARVVIPLQGQGFALPFVELN